MSRKYKQYFVKMKSGGKVYSFMVEFEMIKDNEDIEKFTKKCVKHLRKKHPDLSNCELESFTLIKG